MKKQLFIIIAIASAIGLVYLNTRKKEEKPSIEGIINDMTREEVLEQIYKNPSAGKANYEEMNTEQLKQLLIDLVNRTGA